MIDDPLKRLEDAMAAPPAPRRKSAAAEAAMRAFDEEFSETTQGSANAPRPTSQTTKLRSWIMTTLSPSRLRPALMGGASFASAELSDESEAKRPAVQVGDPFLEKSLVEACLEAFKTGGVAAAQDMGAAGLTCSSLEMADKS